MTVTSNIIKFLEDILKIKNLKLNSQKQINSTNSDIISNYWFKIIKILHNQTTTAI